MKGAWNVAEAKADLSRLIAEARNAPQVISKHGSPVAVVADTED